MALLFYFDLETTGVHFWKNGIHQLSGMVEVDGEIKEKFDFKVRPNPKAIIEQAALDVAGVKKEDILQYPEMIKVYREITAILGRYVDKYNKTQKFFLVGYNNAAFDNNFLRAFFVQCRDDYFGSWFWSSPIDVFVLASQKLMMQRHTMPNFKLMTVAKHLNIPLDESKLHNAMYDIEITKAIYEKIK
jgi:DNA polymerase-3 subunit epsilon